MGTNYYWDIETGKCDKCGAFSAFSMHIGKSSVGWKFSLHVIPEGNPYDGNPITSLEDWIPLFDVPGSCISNEYGDILTKDEMINIITSGLEGDDKDSEALPYHTVAGEFS